MKIFVALNDQNLKMGRTIVCNKSEIMIVNLVKNVLKKILVQLRFLRKICILKSNKIFATTIIK